VLIYAIFFCFQAGNTSGCRPVEPPRYEMGYAIQGTTYASEKACEAAIARYAGYAPAKNGRHYVGTGMWYECEHRHVDAWQGQ
jgi:hypothetical protein